MLSPDDPVKKRLQTNFADLRPGVGVGCGDLYRINVDLTETEAVEMLLFVRKLVSKRKEK